MKRVIWFIVFLVFLLSGCGADKTRVQVLDRAMDLYNAEPVFLEDYPCPGTSGTAGWIQEDVSYFLITDADHQYTALSIDEYGENTLRAVTMNMGKKELLVNMQGFVDANGFLHVLCREEKSNESGLETGYFLSTFDTQGECIKETDCTDAMISVGAYKRTSLLGKMLPDGRLLFFETDLDGKTSMVIFSADGEVLWNREVASIPEGDYFLRGMLLCDENHLLTMEYDGKKNEYSIGRISIETGERELLVSGITVEGWGGCTLKKYDGENQVYYETADSVWVCNFAARTTQMLFSYEDFGLSASEAGGALLLDDGTWCFTRYCQQNNKETYNIIRLKKTVGTISLKEKTILTLAVSNSQEIYASDINSFHMAQKDIKIEVKVYGDDESFAKDLLTGDIPDLVDLELSEVYDEMMKKDLLQDISIFFERETALSKEDFLPKALELYGQEGKLYAVPYGIQLYGMMGDAGYFQGKDGWSLKEFIKFIEEVPNPEKLTSGISNLEFVGDLCYYNLDDFVDISAGTCNFMQEGFLELLECAKLFPKPDMSSQSLDALLDGVISGDTKLLSVRLADVEDYEYWRTLFPGKGELLGFPTAQGGSMCIGGCGFAYAMTSTCTHKEEAWEFLKYVMTHEKENMETHRFPSYRPLYDKFIEKEKKEADEEEKTWQTIVCGIIMDIPHANDEEIKMLEEYLETGRVISQRNEKIVRIIVEETQPFFNGAKTAMKTAETIQKRVNLYLKEQ